MKLCSRCRQEKPLGDFWARAGTKTGRSPQCKACTPKRPRMAGIPGGHPCEKCGAPVPAHRHGGRIRKFCSRECAVAANNARGHRKYTLGRYGLTQADYEAMLAEQGNSCAICGTSDPLTQSGSWHVDHCHDTGIVRGLLCTRCNIGIGQLDHDPKVLLRAAKYLGVVFAPGFTAAWWGGRDVEAA